MANQDALYSTSAGVILEGCAFKGTYFTEIDELLIRLYYLYRRSQRVRTSVVLAEASLRRKRTTPGPHLRPVLAAVNEANGKGTFLFNGVELQARSTEPFKRQTTDIINTIVSCIGTRFSSFKDDPVIMATEILDPSNYPSDPEALLDYGLDEVQTISDHFKPLLLRRDVMSPKLKGVDEGKARHQKTSSEGAVSPPLEEDAGPEPELFNPAPAVARWWNSGIHTKRQT
ncbi:putative zinc finger protein [Apostichopus japonicus]|uniref:Putative zinc finger protein n=1 Tax=Stichopus japonicus TaxID=307972 RepID=A0A2G8LF45_STIJA|nr:putative zinc finger protein [Apostichopus japonicus]